MTSRIKLQNLITPEVALPTDPRLYFFRTEEVALNTRTGQFRFLRGGTLFFDCYMNLFNLGTWSRACALDNLGILLRGKGRFAVEIIRLQTPGEEIIAAEKLCTLSEVGEDIELGQDLGLGAEPHSEGVVWLRLTAWEDEAEFHGGYWYSDREETADVDLAISVTTFRREDEVASTAARITEFLDQEEPELGIQVRLQIVDNGGTIDLSDHPKLRVIQSRNLGGAGGFARGLHEARGVGATHVLFMDDDASFSMENIRRAAALLRLSRKPNLALAGAMISDGNRWAMWENGAVFDRVCRPLFVGLDLRNRDAVKEMELSSARDKPANFYGGWWFFLFPVSHVRHEPFPFFVRGDDISFSIGNDFDIATLGGVVSFQEDFSAKESALTLYLDLRNHLHHHLVHDILNNSALATLKIALRFVFRSIVRMHYESAEAQLQAWKDVLKGPEFFSQNADMAEKRAEITSLVRTEAWTDVNSVDHVTAPEEPSVPKTSLMKWSLNGHLIPFFGFFGRRVSVPAKFRGLIWPVWGAKEAVFYTPDLRKRYIVRHDKLRAVRIILATMQMGFSWLWNYESLRRAHRRGYDDLTRAEFWESEFAAEQTAAR